ncbi:MAG: OmpA family protein [Lishizhenia sp.]
MKFINNTIYTICFLFSFAVFGQNVEFKSANFKEQKEELKAVLEGLKSAEEYFELGLTAVFEVREPGLNFKKALEYYKQAQVLNSENAKNNFNIAVCYFYSSAPYKGIKFIRKAKALDENCDPFLPYYLALSYHLEEDFNEALKLYKAFEANYRKADNFSKFVTQRKRECSKGIELKAKPERVWIDNMNVLNTEHNEIAPSISTDGSSIIFSSNRPNNNKTNEVGEYDLDIYSTLFENGKWSSPRPIKGAVNSPLDETVNNLYYDGTKMLLHRDIDGQTDIFESQLSGLNWSAPKILAQQISSSRANEKYASYNFDGYKLYFARDNANRSNGTEIMFAGMENRMTEKYGAATMVSTVNSKFNDGPIYLHIDGETMYIASEGHGSMGGYDIFVSYKKQGTWSKPENMGYPINTPYDDYFFAATANGKYAYISSNRNGGLGDFDIYKVTFWGPQKETVVDMEDYLLASIALPIKDPQIESKVKVNKGSLTVFKGKTIDALSREAVEAEIVITDNTTGKEIEQFNSNSATGKFLLSLTAGKNYGIAVKADGYLFHSENFDIKSDADYNLINKTIELKNIAIGSKIALRNIFFDVGKSSLRSESNTELDRLVSLMKDVPLLKIEISGHTDNTGSAALNESLSQKRAEAVVRYLEQRGISTNRMSAKGYGSSQPIESNSTADGRQQNRRTEFEIKSN